MTQPVTWVLPSLQRELALEPLGDERSRTGNEASLTCSMAMTGTQSTLYERVEAPIWRVSPCCIMWGLAGARASPFTIVPCAVKKLPTRYLLDVNELKAIETLCASQHSEGHPMELPAHHKLLTDRIWLEFNPAIGLPKNCNSLIQKWQQVASFESQLRDEFRSLNLF